MLKNTTVDGWTNETYAFDETCRRYYWERQNLKPGLIRKIRFYEIETADENSQDHNYPKTVYLYCAQKDLPLSRMRDEPYRSFFNAYSYQYTDFDIQVSMVFEDEKPGQNPLLDLLALLAQHQVPLGIRHWIKDKIKNNTQASMQHIQGTEKPPRVQVLPPPKATAVAAVANRSPVPLPWPERPILTWYDKHLKVPPKPIKRTSSTLSRESSTDQRPQKIQQRPY